MDLVDFRKGNQISGSKTIIGTIEQKVTMDNYKSGNFNGDDTGRSPLHWLKYKHMDGYFNGLRTLVPLSEYIPEFPSQPDSPPIITIAVSSSLPTPTPYAPQPDYQSSEYQEKYHAVQQCYLDLEDTVTVPDLYVYDGLPQGVAQPALGSYELLGIREDVCYDRFGRYGPYGLGYSLKHGGVGEGMDTESEESEHVWNKTGRISYRGIDWGKLQARCLEKNRERFFESEEKAINKYKREKDTRPRFGTVSKQKIGRIAIVIRTYVGFHWTHLAILNFRAMISELSLRSGSEYTVHFLLHVKDNEQPIWADAETVQRILDTNMPPEFHSITTLWSHAQMKLLYPGRFGDPFENPSNQDIHGVYRSAHMPLQHFAMMHPEYENFWNWEMDMRYVGNYYELFDRLGSWAKQQSRVELWERSQKYYVPGYHGSWSNFTEVVHEEIDNAGRLPIFGPVTFPGKQSLRAQQRGFSFMPDTCTSGRDITRCGIDEDADLITLNPIFDADESGWVFAGDVTGYDRGQPVPPRRCAIVTASRLSRRLLGFMHEETWRLHHSMFSEMFPASVALHHGLKAVYAPHPVYLDRKWEIEKVDSAFNGGRDHSTSGHGSPFDIDNEHNHAGTSWYYNSEFAGLLWRRWLGYAQYDGRDENGGRAGEGTLRGGKSEESREGSTGRLCLRSMLVHPIKWEKPSERI
ncbi:hypothetical protein VP1G_06292 [Cytospora mali]|uniref:Uncharacterized protein n=1 Tax=Cytospora mali TaxID=578113 RepID=A0A194V525_CYTMA|nr:hypothetical protein VP1G_06292 [Valsa mali var. pyri (nom. inval.)]